MNRLTYVDNGKDQMVVLKDDEMHFDNVIDMVNSLFDRGIRIVGFENGNVKLWFDTSADGIGIGSRAKIGGSMKKRTVVR